MIPARPRQEFVGLLCVGIVLLIGTGTLSLRPLTATTDAPIAQSSGGGGERAMYTDPCTNYSGSGLWATIVGPTVGNVSQQLTFILGICPGNTGVGYTYYYDLQFGDGSVGGGMGCGCTLTESHTYESQGTYHLSLWVNDSGGESVYATHDVRVSDLPFTTPPAPFFSGVTLVVSALGGIAALVLAIAVLATLEDRKLRRGRSPQP